MPGTLWIPGFERLTPSKRGGDITSTVGPHVIWHTVEAPDEPKYFDRMVDVLTEKSAEPHVLISPKYDRAGQFFPLDLSGRALKNDDGRQTNRTGEVCIQIEVMGYAAQPFTDDGRWNPGPNWRALMTALRSWDVPDIFPMGRPPKYPGPSVRDREIYYSEAGHYCHANVPGNNHGDPGAIAPSRLFALGPAVKPPVTDSPEDDPFMALTDEDAAKIGAAVAKAIYPGDQKLVVADNNFDSQRAAYEAVAQAEATRILAGETPSTPDRLKAAKDAVWSFLRPLWSQS